MMASCNRAKAALLAVAILHCLELIQAGPVSRSIRLRREVYPEIEPEKLEGNQAQVCVVGDVVYGVDEPVPAEQPCLKCKCQPPGVHCETTRCTKKPGCRAIHKPNQCCPDYQCECIHKGKSYANGERLETVPGGECRVCYCRGGEIQCANVSCYIRTDCVGRTVPGQCCPKYDHCPPKAPTADRSLYTTESTLINSDSYSTWTLGAFPTNTSSENEITDTTPQYEVDETNKIDILDLLGFDKGSTRPSENTAYPQDFSTPSNNEDHSNSIHIHQLDEQSKNGEQKHFVPEITIQEIIPEIKEIPITGPPKREISKGTNFNFDKSDEKPDKEVELTHSEDNYNNDLLDAETDSSEVQESYHQPPPVLRIGDKLLFLKKGELVPEKDASTPSPVITIIGAEGLQRGFEESLENHEIKDQTEPPQATIRPEDEEEAIKQVVLQESYEYNESKHLKPPSDLNIDFEDPVSPDASNVVSSFFKHQNNGEESTPPVLEANPEMVTEKKPTYYIEEAIVNQVKNLASTEGVPIVVERTEMNQTGSGEQSGEGEMPFLTSVDMDNTTIDIAVELATVPTNNSEQITTNKSKLEQATTPEYFSSPSSTDIMMDTSEITTIGSVVTDSTTEKESATEVNVTEKSEKVEQQVVKIDEELKDDIIENPEYPPIPDIMVPQHIEEVLDAFTEVLQAKTTQKPSTTESSTNQNPVESKILPNVLEMRSNSSVEGNATHAEWLKNEMINENATLPKSILDMPAASDEIENEENVTSSSTVTTTEGEGEEKTTQITENNTVKVNKQETLLATLDDATESILRPGLLNGKIIDSNPLTQNHLKALDDDGKISSEISSSSTSTVTVVTESEKSSETMEETSSESGSTENTTPKSQQDSLMSNEDASIPSTKLTSTSSKEYDSDLVEILPGHEISSEEKENTDNKKGTTTESTKLKDVEVIEIKDLSSSSTTSTTSTTTEKFVDVTKPTEASSLKDLDESLKAKQVIKRDGIVKDDEDNVFQQLAEELDREENPDKYALSKEEEKKEAEIVFKELMEEINAPKTNKPKDVPQTPESTIMQKVSDALAKLTLKESRANLDSSVLGILRDFFSAQYKSYAQKK